jgi:hypothetical protein
LIHTSVLSSSLVQSGIILLSTVDVVVVFDIFVSSATIVVVVVFVAVVAVFVVVVAVVVVVFDVSRLALVIPCGHRTHQLALTTPSIRS